ncbi:hypothetical protein IQ226_04680 [Dolichospermum sp. LEGE 00240]|jgi:hypothetical protein|uniref:hypothetical protein n=1 Tax=Dolichospermum sp. LEGE 00240 TaxID=1828603 RepID=UPI00187E5D30|nr:hypothetical protein [Dolichospermum sp. LEGE 00240]MDM3844471.1 hypothetical protein [Aphanizomenon gracile PMC638.10]MDM3851979.1 hypothetical protein [Aphanizomenon gracile PMC627.10]MDM3857284.1 hypothetical protein [Aphanizomenon gracile PMC649.10]MDM3859590.1 hypothetical protein [Aphanizomenon gracile PMC644.10]MBE9248496.1 hypothetical protein [Dolichospermum sp. LEGE 00240]
MKKIVINDLYSSHLLTFVDDLKPPELGVLLGRGLGGFYPYLGLSPNVFITTVYDGINTISTTYEGAGNFHDNKFNTIDYARTVNAWVNR